MTMGVPLSWYGGGEWEGKGVVGVREGYGCSGVWMDIECLLYRILILIE